MRSVVLVLVAAILGVAQPGFGRGLIAEGGGLALTPEDLRFEVRKLGPSYTFNDAPGEREVLVDLLTSRFFLAESALARGYGDEGLTEAVATAEAQALGEAYRTWRIEKAVRVPRVESKQVLAKLDRKLHVKELVFSDYQDAARALKRLDSGETFEQVAASLSGAAGVVVQDPGWRIWREFDRPVAIRVFNLLPGQHTRIMTLKQGHTICGLVEDAVWGESEDELIYLRSRRFVRWVREADAAEEMRLELARRFGVTYNPEGVRALNEAIRISMTGQMPSESLLTPWVLRFEGRDGEAFRNGGYFFSTLWTLDEPSRPYVGDAYAIERFALDTILPELESAAGYALGLSRLRDVAWSVKAAREEYLLPRMEELLTTGVQLVPGDIEAYFEAHRSEMMSKMEYKMRRILVASSEDAQAVLAELRAGRDFAQLASERSLDTTTAGRGGDLGNFTAGMFTYYDSLAVALDPGETSDPHTISDGVEILKLEERTLPRALTLDEAQSYVGRVALEAKTNKVLSDWVEGVKRGCGFRVDQDLLASLELPQPDWRAGVVRDSPSDEEPAENLETGSGAGTGTDGSKAKSDGPVKSKPSRRRMVKRQG